MSDELPPPPCQRILEEQGYLVIGASGKRWEIGQVIPWCRAPGFQDVPGPLMIIGMATDHEYQSQASLYSGRPKNNARKYDQYLKVIAE